MKDAYLISSLPPQRLPAASAAWFFCGLWIAAALLAACDWTPDVGPPLEERCENTDSDPGTAVSWSADIFPLINRFSGGCAACHYPDGINPVGVTVGGLDLSSYDAMRKGGARSGPNIVLPGEPCESVLYQKVLPGPPIGVQMPANGPPFLSLSEQQQLKDWIAEGALEN